MGNKVIKDLLSSRDPAIKLKTYIRLLDYEYDNPEIVKILSNIKKKSLTIKNIFAYLPKSEQDKEIHVYKKWEGAHWLISQLADISYPPGDTELEPSINQVLKWLLSGKKRPIINGRRRFCASQEGNGIYSAVSLGFNNERIEELVERLLRYQWDDGGWNCDRKPHVEISSYHESLIPLRGLNQYYKENPSQKLRKAMDKTIELFLKRKLFRKLDDNSIINKKWLLLRYPTYWHYEILMVLKVLAETNSLSDKRTSEGLDILESKRLPDGGFPKEAKYCQSSNPDARYYTPVDWKPVNKRKMNEWVTIDALYILKEAKRIDIDF